MLDRFNLMRRKAQLLTDPLRANSILLQNASLYKTPSLYIICTLLKLLNLIKNFINKKSKYWRPLNLSMCADSSRNNN